MAPKTGLANTIALKPNYTHAQFKRYVYDRVVSQQADRIIKRFKAKTAQYKKGGRYFQVGQAALRAEFVPPIALMFSLLGAFTHIIKSLVTLLVVVRPKLHGAIKVALIGGAVAIVLIVPLRWHNAVTVKPAYQHLERIMQKQVSRPTGYLIRWVMRVEPRLYPVGAALGRLRQI